MNNHGFTGSKSFQKLNPALFGGQTSSAKPEHPACEKLLVEASREEENSSRCLVGITSFRRRTLDADNLAGGCKYFIDALRYTKLIRNDNPESITLQISQEKVKTKSEERTEITIEQI